MTTWPTSPVDVAALDSALDDPSLARAALKDALEKLNQMIGAQPGLLGVRVYDTAGTFTYNATPGTKSIILEMIGAQGGNSYKPATTSTQNGASSAGGRGEYAKVRITAGFDGKPVVIGAGGAGGKPTGSGPTYMDGVAGGNSSFGGSMLVCRGGAGGLTPDPAAFAATDTVTLSATYSTSDAPSTTGQLLGWARAMRAGCLLMFSRMHTVAPNEYGALPMPGNAGILPPPEIIFPSSAAAVGRAGQSGAAVIYEFG